MERSLEYVLSELARFHGEVWFLFEADGDRRAVFIFKGTIASDEKHRFELAEEGVPMMLKDSLVFLISQIRLAFEPMRAGPVIVATETGTERYANKSHGILISYIINHVLSVVAVLDAPPARVIQAYFAATPLCDSRDEGRYMILRRR